MSYAVSKIRRGDTTEVECPRTQTRLQTTMAILKTAGAIPTEEHDPQCKQTVFKEDACKGWDDWMRRRDCLKTIWPEWVTDEMIQDAYNLSHKIVTERGAYNRAQSEQGRRAR